MVLQKLQEALAEVDAQRTALDQVEKDLRSMIAKLSGTPEVMLPPKIFYPPSYAPSGERDGIDDIVDILRAEGKPLHAKFIAERLSAQRGKPVLRTSFESGLNRHVAKAKVRRVERFGPSLFGLPEWKHQASFARTA